MFNYELTQVRQGMHEKRKCFGKVPHPSTCVCSATLWNKIKFVDGSSVGTEITGLCNLQYVLSLLSIYGFMSVDNILQDAAKCLLNIQNLENLEIRQMFNC